MNITIARGEESTGPQLSAISTDPSFYIAVKIVDENQSDAFRRLMLAVADFMELTRLNRRTDNEVQP